MRESRGSAFTSVFSGSFDLNRSQVIEARKSSFKEADLLPASLTKYTKKLSSEGIPDVAGINNYFTFDDDSKILVLEISGGYRMQRNSYAVEFLQTGNVYVVGLNSKNEPEWLQLVSKFQEEPDLHLYTGMNSIKSADGIHLFFHDRASNTEAGTSDVKLANVGNIKKHQLASVFISKKGAIKKQFLEDNAKVEFRLSPGKSRLTYDNRLVYLALNYKLLKPFLYRISTIIIN
jgi:hypothetical protein